MSRLANIVRAPVDYLKTLLRGPPPDPADVLVDIPEADRDIFREVRRHTMAGVERVAALCEAVRYVERAGVPGAIVECGVWRGGSVMAIAKTLLAVGSKERDLFLFDTFEGMTPPDQNDVSIDGQSAGSLSQSHEMSEEDLFWCYAPLDAVRNAVLSTGYPADRVHFIKGRVEDTVPADAPERIALLRLDTDWYQSTHHEMVHLYPRLQRSGVLVIDDYGHWLGARKAVDEYLAANRINLLLSRIDYTARMAIKLD